MRTPDIAADLEREVGLERGGEGGGGCINTIENHYKQVILLNLPKSLKHSSKRGLDKIPNTEGSLFLKEG